ADFIVAALDTRFGPWLYLLPLSLLLLAWDSGLRNLSKRAWRRLRSDDLLCLCLCITLSTCLLVAQAETKFNWYVAVATPFLAIM
ncbi:hypothetical protein ACXYUI_30440, partial [Klebsiella pneumoniae]